MHWLSYISGKPTAAQSDLYCTLAQTTGHISTYKLQSHTNRFPFSTFTQYSQPQNANNIFNHLPNWGLPLPISDVSIVYLTHPDVSTSQRDPRETDALRLDATCNSVNSILLLYGGHSSESSLLPFSALQRSRHQRANGKHSTTTQFVDVEPSAPEYVVRDI